MANNHNTEISAILVGYSQILGIVGDIVRVQVPEEKNGKGAAPCLEDLAVLEAVDGSLSLAQVIGIKREVVSLQVFGGTRGISTDSTVRFLGHPMQVSYSAISSGGCSGALENRATAVRIFRTIRK